jgi:hypothetical protein
MIFLPGGIVGTWNEESNQNYLPKLQLGEFGFLANKASGTAG